MKKELKFELEEEDLKNLKSKAEQSGFIGRGSLVAYLRKIARTDLVFIDSNFKRVAKEFILK